MLRQGFKTKREADTALAAAQQSVEQGSVVSKSSMKVDAFLDQWLASQQGRLKASTHHSYVITSKRIRSGLGHVQVQSLTPIQIEKFYADLLDATNAVGVELTESFAMWPGSSVSGQYFAHPDAKYFGVGKIKRDQLNDYAARKGWTVEEGEQHLAPVLDGN